MRTITKFKSSYLVLKHAKKRKSNDEQSCRLNYGKILDVKQKVDETDEKLIICFKDKDEKSQTK